MKGAAEGQLRLISQYLRAGQNLEKEVHEARKGLKKVRALLRLVKDEIGPVYSEENRRWRDAGRQLSAVRDAHAMVELFDQFAGKHRLKRKLAAIRSTLQDRKNQLEQTVDWPQLMRHLANELAASERRVEDWPLHFVAPSDLEAALKNGYRQAFRALKAVSLEPSADHFHELRKRTKTHLFQLRCLEECGGRERMAILKQLSDCLGQQHNLVVLEQALPHIEIAPLMVRERERLQRRALLLAGEVFSQRPKDFGYPARSDASPASPKTSSRMIRSVASFK